jgi:Pentapeptide repeats (8 copies)
VIEIKRWTDGKVLYVAKTAADVRSAVLEAVREKANLGYADLGSADLGYADLGYANLRSANLGSANLGSADLGSANLGSADLRYADLGYADLGSADLRYADLGYANLRSADLRSANLGSADLRYADLRYADLGYADLRYADLGSADLGYAKNYNPYRVNDLLLLLDQPGKIRAYKLTDAQGNGPFTGGIHYEVGGSYEVKNASTDASEDCGAGINLATLPWCMKEWRPSYRIFVAEFKAADIAAIPTGDGKFRVHRCTVVAEKDLEEIGLVVKEELAEAAA